MFKSVLMLVKQLTRAMGFDIIKFPISLSKKYPDFDNYAIETIDMVKEFTMTTPERIFALCEAVKYIIINNIPGDIVECGVWKGGSMMAIARTLLNLNNTSRSLYLFDTFEGMPPPISTDIDYRGRSADELLYEANKSDTIWGYAPMDAVKQNLKSVGYDNQKIHFVKGMVEQTIPAEAPKVISLLRLDTDWYESTRHELIHLIPRLSVGGVIIIDDYGHWQGSRQATDEYIKDNKIKLLLNRVDYACRIAVKLE